LLVGVGEALWGLAPGCGEGGFCEVFVALDAFAELSDVVPEVPGGGVTDEGGFCAFCAFCAFCESCAFCPEEFALL
jgi:hypothetical protein